jgi:hypothetical protein
MKKTIWMATCLLLGITACNTNEIFEEELYKKVVALISSDNYNILEDEQELTGEENVTYIAVSCGGTGAAETDVRVTLIPDNTPFDAYNRGMYDADATQYAKLLPQDKYAIDDYHILIPKGERTGKLAIRIRPDGLSPDSVYFIPLSIGALSAYEVNPEKNNILYRVLIKNFYAEQLSSGYTFYTMRGLKNGANATATKQVQPLSKNKVRMMAGNIPFVADVSTFEQSAVVLEVQSDNKVLVSTYKDMEVTQEDDPDYPNVFRTETDDWGRKYKIFLLAYSYRDGSSTIQMREELRLQYTED